MSHLILPDYTVRYLLPPCIEDWIPMDAPVRLLREIVDALNLKELGFISPTTTVGRPMFAPSMLLKIYLYCYMERIRSTRKIERECYKDINLIWLTGHNFPDHNTLWRFWDKNKFAIGNIFKQTILLALEMDLVGFALHAVDGTKIRAACSESKALKKKVLKEVDKKLDEQIAEIEADIEKSENEKSENEKDPECRLPKELQDAKKLREQVKVKMAKLKEAGTNNLQPSEPEARVMKMSVGHGFCYNAQVVADKKTGIVVAADVLNEENDMNALTPMLDEVKENLGKVAETTLADKGYDSGQQLERAEKRQYNVLVNQRKDMKREDSRFSKSNFIYDEERDVFICPLGKDLKFEQSRYRKDRDLFVMKYRCMSFRDCPMREICSKDKRGRSVEEYKHRKARIRHSKRLEYPANKEKLKQRMAIVEPVFARIKWLDGFVRWTVKGLENVKAQWSMICSVHNLKRIFANWSKKGPKKAAIEMKIVPKAKTCSQNALFHSTTLNFRITSTPF